MKPILICLVLFLGCADVGSPPVVPIREGSPCAHYIVLEFERVNIAVGLNRYDLIIATTDEYREWWVKPLHLIIPEAEAKYGRLRKIHELY